jgi:hypothetical protein
MTPIREVALVNSTDYSLESRIRKPERLDETMTRSDIIDVLKRLRFDVDDQCTIWLGRSVRDFLVTALTNAHRK